MSNDQRECREAHVNRTGDGQSIGLALFINASELRSLGIDPEETDRVIYSVENGEIHLQKPNRAVLAE